MDFSLLWAYRSLIFPTQPRYRSLSVCLPKSFIFCISNETEAPGAWGCYVTWEKSWAEHDNYDIAFLSFPKIHDIYIYIYRNDCLICEHLWAVKTAEKLKWLLLLKAKWEVATYCKWWHLTSGGSAWMSDYGIWALFGRATNDCKWKWCDVNLALGKFLWKCWTRIGRNQSSVVWLGAVTAAQMAWEWVNWVEVSWRRHRWEHEVRQTSCFGYWLCDLGQVT